MRTRCDKIHNSARTMPHSWDVYFQVVIIALSVTSETQATFLSIFFYISAYDLSESNT